MRPLINTALLKEQLKRFWFIGALTLAAYVLFMLVPLYRPVNYVSELRSQIESMVRLLSMKNVFVLFAGILAPLTVALTLFAYLFQPRATTAVHALPVNKKQLFFTNAAAGFILFVVPLFILCAALLIPVRFPSPDFQLNNVSVSTGGGMYIQAPAALFPNGLVYNSIINTLPVVAGFFVRTLITQVFCFAVSLLAVSIAGNAVVAILCAGALPLLPLGLYLLALMTGTYYVFGFSAYSMNTHMEQFMTYINPLAMMIRYEGASFLLGNTYAPLPGGIQPVWPLLILYAAVAGVLMALACLCAHKRRQERAGESIVFTPVKNLLIFALSLFGMLLMGLFLMSVIKSIPALYIGYGVGFVLAYFVAQMIAEKAVNVLYKAKSLLIYGGVVIVLFILVTAATRFDITGYTQYVPAEAEVAGVYLGGAYEYYGGNNGDIPFHFIEDKDVIADTLALHREILYNQGELRKVYLNSLSGQTTDYYANRSQDILYLLTDGSVIARAYMLNHAFAARPGVNLYTLLDKEAVVLSTYHILKSPSLMDNLTVEFYDNQSKQSREIKVTLPDDVRSVTEAIKQDLILSERKWNEERRSYAEDFARLGYIPTPQAESAKEDEEIRTGYDNWCWYVTLTDKRDMQRSTYARYYSLGCNENTKAWLEANGYFTFLED